MSGHCPASHLIDREQGGGRVARSAAQATSDRDPLFEPKVHSKASPGGRQDHLGGPHREVLLGGATVRANGFDA